MTNADVTASVQRISPDHVEHPALTDDVADELHARIYRLGREVDELWQLVALLAGYEDVD